MSIPHFQKIKLIDDEQTLEELKKAIEGGCNIPMACLKVGISRRHFHQFMRLGEKVAQSGKFATDEDQRYYNFYRTMGPIIVQKIQDLLDEMDEQPKASEARLVLTKIEKFWPNEALQFHDEDDGEGPSKQVTDTKDILQVVLNFMNNESFVRILLNNDQDGRFRQSIKSAIGIDDGSGEVELAELLPPEFRD